MRKTVDGWDLIGIQGGDGPAIVATCMRLPVLVTAVPNWVPSALIHEPRTMPSKV